MRRDAAYRADRPIAPKPSPPMDALAAETPPAPQPHPAWEAAPGHPDPHAWATPGIALTPVRLLAA